VRSAGDSESTAVQAPEDQLAARRARRERGQTSTRKGPSQTSPPPASGPIDPNAGTGLIDNIVCDPEPEVDDTRGETVDDVLDRYAAGSGAPEAPHASMPTQSAEHDADPGCDEIEAQLQTYHERRAARPEHSQPRGSADLSSGVAQLRRARRRSRPAHIRTRRLRGVRHPWAAAITTLVAVGVLVVGVVGETGATSSPRSRAAGDQVPGVMRSDAGTSQALAASAQVSAAARARILAATQIQKSKVATAKQHQETLRRHRNAQRRARTAARDRARAQAKAQPRPTPTQPAASPATTQSSGAPNAPDRSTDTNSSSAATHSPASSGAAGPTKIGSVSGGCDPKCS